MVFSGLTVANIVGVPAVPDVGNAVSWRLTFLLIAGVGIVALLASP